MPGAPGGHGPYCASSCANDKECPECGALLEHARVFCASMADIFEDYTGPDIIRLQNERARLFNLITGTPNLDWLLLTKRPENILTMVPESWLSKFPENVWAMTTVENQEQANTRIPHLLKVPARVRGLSMEPLLEEVHIFNEVSGDLEYWSGKEDHSDRIDWIICGGESGPGARPMHPKWARSVRDQCQAAHDGVPFFFKQWGDWLPYKMGHAYIDGFHEARTLQPSPEIRDQGWPVYRVGKAKAGRLLDGKEWNELPG